VRTDPLGVDTETMRRLGYRTVDLLVDWRQDESAPPLHLPVFPDRALNALVRDYPAIGEKTRTAAPERVRWH
jgi:hypothetical protein